MVLCMALAAAVLTSCRNDSRVAVCQYANISNGAWDRPDRITFPVDSISTNGNYRLTISLRTTNEVQFQTFYLTAEQHFTHPEHHSTDTVAVALTDETGKIQGKGLGLYNYSVALATTTPLRQGQSGEITVGHIMRRNQLAGIINVGIKLTHEDSSY